MIRYLALPAEGREQERPSKCELIHQNLGLRFVPFGVRGFITAFPSLSLAPFLKTFVVAEPFKKSRRPEK